MRTLTASFLGLLAVLAASSVAQADPLPGRDLLKFSQQPMIATTIPDTTGVVNVYGGHDELSTAYGFATAAGPPKTTPADSWPTTSPTISPARLCM